jgi:hypothetical protein
MFRRIDDIRNDDTVDRVAMRTFFACRHWIHDATDS